jgi:hypothetical protein
MNLLEDLSVDKELFSGELTSKENILNLSYCENIEDVFSFVCTPENSVSALSNVNILI